MSWTTSELADLAGTTVNTIRLYHRRGLLDEPARTANNYRRYEVTHLLALLRAKRLAQLGIPLAQIAEIERSPRATPDLSHIVADVRASIDKLQSVLLDLTEIAAHGAPTDLPPGFGDVAVNLSAADRTMVLIYSRILDDAQMVAMHELMRTPRTPAKVAFEALDADADLATRVRVAADLREAFEAEWTAAPWTRDLLDDIRRHRPGDQVLVRDALLSVSNAAQADVLQRMHPLLASV